MDIAIFQYIGGTVENAVSAFLLPAISRLIAVLSGLVTMGMLIYITIIGFSILLGVNRQPIGQLIAITLKVAAVGAIAFNANLYNTYIVDMFVGFETLLAEALNGTSGATTIYGVLDNLTGEAATTVQQAFLQVNEVGTFNVGAKIIWGLCGVVLMVASVAIVLLGGGALLVQKIVFAVLMALGPLYLMFALWPATAKWFTGWFSQVMNSVMVVVIVSVVMSFATLMFTTFIASADMSGMGIVSPIAIILESAILGGVIVFVIYQSNSLAAGLAGGLSTGAFTAGAMASSVRTPMRVINPQSVRRDMQSGLQSKASRLDHITAGNTIANPAYSRALMQRLGSGQNSNWALTPSGGQVKNKS